MSINKTNFSAEFQGVGGGGFESIYNFWEK